MRTGAGRRLCSARGPLGGVLLALFLVSGCAATHPFGFGATTRAGKEAHTPTGASPEAIKEGVEPAGLLGFVTSAAPGESRIFEDAAKGTMRVTMGRQYHSADAVVCRRFTLSPLGLGPAMKSQTRAVCREAQGWTLDPIGSIGALPIAR